jgi:hypothetical protein
MNLTTLVTLTEAGEVDKSSTLYSQRMVRITDLVGPGGTEIVWYGTVRIGSFC